MYTGETTPKAQEQVIAVPENYDFVYDPLLSRPNQVIGLNLRFSLINTLLTNEVVTLFLPEFGNKTVSNGNITMLAMNPTTLAQLPITGAWDKTNEKIIFTARSDIDFTRAPLGNALYPRGILVEIFVRASNGITGESLRVAKNEPCKFITKRQERSRATISCYESRSRPNLSRRAGRP